jgi:hypothetical protein
MLPVEVRIMPTYKVISDLGMLNTYAGLILPMIVSATAVFLFRQFFMSIPREIAEASQIDGATPMQFFRNILAPMTRTPIAAMFVIQFIYGWNQYLWPLLITTKPEFYTLLSASTNDVGRRCPDRVADRDGDNPARDAAARPCRGAHAETVYLGHDGDGEIALSRPSWGLGPAESRAPRPCGRGARFIVRRSDSVYSIPK